MTNTKKTSQTSGLARKSKTNNSTNSRWDKEELFQSFSVCTREAISNWETYFDVHGLAEQVLGETIYAYENAEKSLRESDAWQRLLALYEYATDGITNGREDSCIVLDAGAILKLVITESYQPIPEWDEILTMGDARYALDDGSVLDLERIALLGNVDIRTVRNAVSAGELTVIQTTDDETFHRRTPTIDNASARRWLHGRKGFKPTVVGSSPENMALEDVRTAADFGTFLKKQRERIGLVDGTQKLTIFHPCANAGTIQQLEAGVFSLPLDAVFRVADFYQLSRKILLACVMRVFFSEELDILSESLK